MISNKTIKQLFGTEKVQERATDDHTIHHVNNITVVYDEELFKSENKVVVRINIEHGDSSNKSKSNKIYQTLTLFCDKKVTE